MMLIIATLVIAAMIGWALVAIFEVEWFRERLLSPNRGTRAIGMLPIVVPLYLMLAVIFSGGDR